MTTAHHVPATAPDTAAAGWICVAGGVVGALQGLAVLGWPPAVGEERFSYPFTETGHAVAQVTFAVQHLALLVGVLALLRVAGPASRTVRGGLGTAAAGLVLLVLVELWGITLADAAVDEPRVALTGALYGVPTVLIGLGMLVAGVGIVRAGWWSGWRRWTVFAVGAFVVVVLLLVDSTFAVGRIVLAGWMLLFAGVGLTLLRAPR
jgi:hypothetical protein